MWFITHLCSGSLGAVGTSGTRVAGQVPVMRTAGQVPAAPADESTEFLELLHSLLHAVRREATSRSDPVGTTPGQVRLLRALQRAGGPRRLGELAQALDVAPRSITAKVDQAEADGLVRRVADPGDRRATLVEMTPDGLGMLARVSAERSVGAGERLARLTPDERAELLRLLRTAAAPLPGT